MTPACTLSSSAAVVDAYAETVLALVMQATWPDGSALVDVDESILRSQLLPHIRAAGQAMVTTTLTGAASSRLRRSSPGSQR